MLSVAVGTDDLRHVLFFRTPLLPAGEDFGGGDVMRVVTFLAGFTDRLQRIEHVGRRNVVLIIPMRERRPVAIHASDLLGGVNSR